MSSVLSFLFQGQTPTSTTNYGTSNSQVPTWLQQYSQGVLGQAAALASQPYQPYGGPQVAGFTPQQTQAQGEVGGLQGQYQPALTQATNLANTSATPGAISQATNYLPTAANYIASASDPTQAMMNPYEQNVINQAENQATQYWNQTLQPSINQQYAAAGQAGSSADINAENQGANLVTQNIQNTAQSALAQGYTGAQQTALAQGQATGALGQTLGGLGYEQGVLGLQGASQLGNLASTGQGLGLQGAAALDTVGGEQQALNQQNLNVGYNNFLTQEQYPYQQEGWLSQMMTGAATPTTVPGASTSAQTGYAPSYGASPLSQSLGLYNLLNPSGS
jgi:hypothetical protein